MSKSNPNSPMTLSFLLLGSICCFRTSHASLSSDCHYQQKPIDLVKDIDSFVQSVMDCSLSPALTLSVVKDGRLVISKGYGYTSAGKTKRVTSKTKFAIGSLTKAFTSLLIAKKVKESNNITLDTPISQFISDFRLVDDYRGEHASLRDILGHRMALPRQDTPIMMGIDPKVSRKEFARKLQLFRSPYSFREKFIYNNYMYVLAGDILEQLSGGQSWEDLVTETIFEPLAMTQSGFVDSFSDFWDDFALPCSLSDGLVRDVDPKAFQSAHVAGPAGTIYSTADDMAKWMTFLLSKGDRKLSTSRLDIDPSMVKMTFEPSIRIYPQSNDLFKPRFPVSHQVNEYCMGWFSGNYREYKKISHSGGIITHSSRLWLYPDMNSGIFVAVNGPVTNKTDILTAIPYYISDLLLGLPSWFNVSDVCSAQRMPWQSRPTDDILGRSKKSNISEMNDAAAGLWNLSDYVGTYTNPLFGDISIRLSDCCNNSFSDKSNQLHFMFGRFGWLQLTPESRSVFTGQIYGPLSYMNDDIDIAIEFHFYEDCKDCDHSAMSLWINIFEEEKTGPFYKQDDLSQHGNGGVENAKFSNTRLFFYLFSLHVITIQLFV